MRARLGRWETLLVALFVVLLPIGQAISPEFLTSDSFTTGSLDFSEIALMALPLTLVVIAAEIDLSIASVLGLSSALMAYLWDHGQPHRGDHPDLHRRRRAVRRVQRRCSSRGSGCRRWP